MSGDAVVSRVMLKFFPSRYPFFSHKSSFLILFSTYMKTSFLPKCSYRHVNNIILSFLHFDDNVKKCLRQYNSHYDVTEYVGQLYNIKNYKKLQCIYMLSLEFCFTLFNYFSFISALNGLLTVIFTPTDFPICKFRLTHLSGLGLYTCVLSFVATIPIYYCHMNFSTKCSILYLPFSRPFTSSTIIFITV